ncbi:MAG: cell filamentation protein Fic, partial [Erysipelotrichia bacterium]|nr:cell filamentation protein Fic [Erysipelotrichia bacterium]
MSEMLIYQNDSGDIKVDVRFEEKSIWLSQAQLCEVFGKSKATISEHISNIFDEGELEPTATVRKFRTVQIEGEREVAREIDFYNLDIIIAIGFRVKSAQGTKFRIWATKRLNEYITKGFALDDERFKSGTTMGYFDELQKRLRDIR